MNVIGYAKPGKAKAKNLLDAFTEGANGKPHTSVGAPRLIGTLPAAFYGVTPELVPLWEQCKAEKRDWVYIDNAYFDPWRETYFRITKNKLQCALGMTESPARAGKLNLPILPWRKSGSFILLCPQSDQFMKYVAGYKGSWTADTIEELRKHTDREIRVKGWNRDKQRWYDEFPAAIKDCWCVVTWSSASAITAMLRGVPAIVMAEDCAAREFAGGWLERVETPTMTDERERMVALCAANQFTLNEMRTGYAWSVVNGA